MIVVATISTALSLGVLWRFGWRWATPPYIVLLSGTVVLRAIDARSFRLPRELVYLTAVVAGGLLTAASQQLHRFDALRTAFAAGAAVYTFFWLFIVVARHQGGLLGDGDARFGALCEGFRRLA